MTMLSLQLPNLRVRALAALICISFYVAVSSASDSTITDTRTSTTVVTTRTTTITLGQSTFASATQVSITTTISDSAFSTTVMSGSGNGVYSGQQFQDAVLNSTNFYREAYQAQPVTWDDELASYAQDYAEECVWEHSGGDYGENLALNFEDPTLAIDSWASEESQYSYSKAKFGEKTGHFTQLVWQATTKVGCGAVQCDEDDVQGWMLVCEYDPPGNVQGAFKENVEKAGDNEGQLGLGGAAGVSVSGLLMMCMVGVSAVIAAGGL